MSHLLVIPQPSDHKPIPNRHFCREAEFITRDGLHSLAWDKKKKRRTFIMSNEIVSLTQSMTLHRVQETVVFSNSGDRAGHKHDMDPDKQRPPQDSAENPSPQQAARHCHSLNKCEQQQQWWHGPCGGRWVSGRQQDRQGGRGRSPARVCGGTGGSLSSHPRRGRVPGAGPTCCGGWGKADPHSLSSTAAFHLGGREETGLLHAVLGGWAPAQPAFTCYLLGCPPWGPLLSSPLQECATKCCPRQPNAGCEVALDWEAPIAPQSRNTCRPPGDRHDPGASRCCQVRGEEQRRWLV